MAMSKKRKNANGNETLAGVITPVQWHNDQITAVALCATDDEEYWIENSEKFFDLVQHGIEATGRVKRDKKAHRSINIKRFSLIK